MQIIQHLHISTCFTHTHNCIVYIVCVFDCFTRSSENSFTEKHTTEKNTTTAKTKTHSNSNCVTLHYTLYALYLDCLWSSLLVSSLLSHICRRDYCFGIARAMCVVDVHLAHSKWNRSSWRMLIMLMIRKKFDAIAFISFSWRCWHSNFSITRFLSIDLSVIVT